MENLVIVTPGRSGSEFLLESLNSNQNFELDGEIFDRSNFADRSFSHFAKTERIVLHRLFNRTRLSRLKFNFGLKILVRNFLQQYDAHQHITGFKLSLDQLSAYPMVADFLKRESTKIIYITAADKLRLSLSLIKARVTNQYHIRHNLSKKTSMTFDLHEVLHLYKWITQEEASFINDFGGHCLTIEKSALFADPLSVLQSIAQYLNISGDQKFEISQMKLVNPENLEDWVENFEEIKEYFFARGVSLSS